MPDTVMIELDEERLSKLIKNYQASSLLGTPATQGLEFLAAVIEARKIGARVILGDRDSQVTIARVAVQYNWLHFLNPFPNVTNLFQPKYLTPEELKINKVLNSAKNGKVDKSWQEDLLDAMREAVATSPDLFKVPSAIGEERDKYLASSLRKCPGSVVVGVVGAAHLGGIKMHLNDNVDDDKLRTELERPPNFSESSFFIGGLVGTSYVLYHASQLAMKPRYFYPKTFWMRYLIPTAAAGCLIDVALVSRSRQKTKKNESLRPYTPQFNKYALMICAVPLLSKTRVMATVTLWAALTASSYLSHTFYRAKEKKVRVFELPQADIPLGPF